MNFEVGEKIRAFCWKEGRDQGIEFTTTIKKLGTHHNGEPEKVLVVWNECSYGWWIYKDTGRDKLNCQGWGKVICKNWKRFEKEKQC